MNVFGGTSGGSFASGGLIYRAGPIGPAGQSVSYQGAWSTGSYSYLNIVTHSDDIWLCNKVNGTSEEPSGSATDWDKLADGLSSGDQTKLDYLTVTGGISLDDCNSHLTNTSNPHTVAHSQLSDKGTNDHSAIDSHLGSTANPHTVTASQLSLGSTDDATFNSVITKTLQGGNASSVLDLYAPVVRAPTMLNFVFQTGNDTSNFAVSNSSGSTRVSLGCTDESSTCGGYVCGRYIAGKSSVTSPLIVGDTFRSTVSATDDITIMDQTITNSNIIALSGLTVASKFVEASRTATDLYYNGTTPIQLLTISIPSSGKWLLSASGTVKANSVDSVVFVYIATGTTEDTAIDTSKRNIFETYATQLRTTFHCQCTYTATGSCTLYLLAHSNSVGETGLCYDEAVGTAMTDPDCAIHMSALLVPE